MTLSATLRTSGLAGPRHVSASPGQRLLLDSAGHQRLAIVVCAERQHRRRRAAGGPGRDSPTFCRATIRDARIRPRLKSSGVAVVSGELQAGLRRDSHSAVPRCPLGGPFSRAGSGRRRGRHAGPAADADLDGRLPARLSRHGRRSPCCWPSRSPLVPAGGKIRRRAGFVLANATLFVVGTWLAIGLRTGIWDAAYLWPDSCCWCCTLPCSSASRHCWPFATASTVVCVFGSIVFWALAWSINYGRHALVAAADALSTGGFSSGSDLADGPGLLGAPEAGRHEPVAVHSLSADAHFSPLFDFSKLTASGFSITLSIAQFAAVHPGRVGPFWRAHWPPPTTDRVIKLSWFGHARGFANHRLPSDRFWTPYEYRIDACRMKDDQHGARTEIASRK